MSAFDRKVLSILAGLSLILVGVIFSGSLVGMPAPELTAAKDGLAETGSRGSFTLTFNEPMLADSVESRLVLTAEGQGQAAALRFNWQGADGKTLTTWPATPLSPGQRYTLALNSGAVSQSGQVLRRGAQWTVQVRQPELLFLAPSTAPDLWRMPLDGQNPLQLTSTNGQIFDFQASPDGERIAYSVRNEQGGIDLWEIDRDGGEPRQILPCQADWCINPAYSPDGDRLVYSRRRASLTPGTTPGVPRLWLLDFATQTTDALYVDPNVGGFDPAWSPDGRFLAFFDGLSQGVRVLEFQSKTDFLLDSEMGMAGAWSPDGQRLFFNNYEIAGEMLSVSIYEVNVLNRQIQRVLGDGSDPVDYSIPVWAPDGKRVAVGMRHSNGAPGKQLWTIQLDAEGRLTERQAVTSDPSFNYAGYHWSPSGGHLVFQSLELGRSNSRPGVMIWDVSSGENKLLAEDAFQPNWLP